MSEDRKGPPWVWWIAVVVLLILCGAGYRLAVAKLASLAKVRIPPPVSLANVPSVLGEWDAEDRPLAPEVERMTGSDEYLNRVYLSRNTGRWASLYIAYSARPRTMVGHRPRTCYVNAGWIHQETTTESLVLPNGKSVPCLLHRFRRLAPRESTIVVVNYYVLNGVVTNDAGSFTGLGWRLPNIGGDPAYYVAQVQVSSPGEAAARRVAELSAQHILDVLPDASGNVKALKGAAAPSEAEPDS